MRSVKESVQSASVELPISQNVLHILSRAGNANEERGITFSNSHTVSINSHWPISDGLMVRFWLVLGSSSGIDTQALPVSYHHEAPCYFPSMWTDKCKAQVLFSVRGRRKTWKTVAILTTVVYDDAFFLFSRRSYMTTRFSYSHDDCARYIYRLFSRRLLYKL